MEVGNVPFPEGSRYVEERRVCLEALTPRGNDLYLDRSSTTQLGCPLYSVTAADRLESVFFFRYQAAPIDPPK